jgi:hypothetical protein
LDAALLLDPAIQLQPAVVLLQAMEPQALVLDPVHQTRSWLLVLLSLLDYLVSLPPYKELQNMEKNSAKAGTLLIGCQ